MKYRLGVSIHRLTTLRGYLHTHFFLSEDVAIVALSVMCCDGVTLKLCVHKQPSTIHKTCLPKSDSASAFLSTSASSHGA